MGRLRLLTLSLALLATSPASPATIADLLRQTDAVTEVLNTIRAGVLVALDPAADAPELRRLAERRSGMFPERREMS